MPVAASVAARVKWPIGATLAAMTLLTVVGCDMFVDANARIAQAEKQLAAADYATALIELKKALKSQPNSARAHFLLAQAALQLGNADDAMEELGRALELGLAPAAAANLMARVELALGRYRPLLEEIEADRLQLPEPARSTYRGQALHGLKREAEAIAAYRAALAVDADSRDAAVGLGEAYATLGQFESALEQLDALMARHPDFAPGWLERGTVLARRGQFAAAGDSLQNALDHATGQLTSVQLGGLLATLTETRLSRGDLEGAAAAQKRLAELLPDSALALFTAARVAVARGDYSSATAELHHLLGAMPEFSLARFLLGSALLAQGNLEQAEQELAQVVQADPANLEARKRLAQVRLQLERPEAAMRVLIPALEAQTADSQLQALTNIAQSQLGADPADVVFLEESLTTHPDNDILKVGLAAAYLRNGQQAKALEMLNRTRGESRLALARFYLTQNQSRKADEVIAQVIGAEPSRAELQNLAGLLYMDAGHYEQALAQLRAAAERQSNNPGYWCNVAQAQLALHQPAAAHEAIDKALAIRADWLPAVAVAAFVDLSSGHSEEAVARVVALRRQHPREAQVLLLEGDVRVTTRQYAAAAEAFEEADRLHPSAATALKSYNARQLAGIADPAEPLRRWLLHEPEDLRVRLVLAEADQTSEPAKAIAEYQWILARTPNNPVALNNLAWLYQSAGDARALETARKARELNPSAPEIADTYGWILLQHGAVAEALPILKAAAAGGSSQIVAHYAEARRRASPAAVQRP